MRLSILDDYQGVALDMADWTPVKGRGVEIAVERFPFADEDDVVRSLADSEIVCAMRERTAFPKRVVDRLPKLKLVITTGMRNASFDMAALKDRGVTVCGTGGPGGGNEDTAELAWGSFSVRHGASPKTTSSCARVAGRPASGTGSTA